MARAVEAAAAKRSLLQRTRQAARRELASVTEVPDLDDLDNVSEVCIGGLVTFVGAAAVLLSVLAVQFFILHPPAQKEALTVPEIQAALAGRSVSEVFRACADEYGEVRAHLHCWLQARGVFPSERLAERAFMDFDCDRNFRVDASEVTEAFRAGQFVCGAGAAGPAAEAPSRPPATAATTAAPLAPAPVAPVTPATAAPAAAPSTAPPTTAPPTPAPTTPAPPATTAALAPSSPQVDAQITHVGPLSLEEYRRRVGRERAAVEIIFAGLPFDGLGPEQLAALSSAIVDVVSRQLGVSFADVANQQGLQQRASLAGVAGRDQVIAACSVALPHGQALDQVRAAMSSPSTKQLLAAEVSTALGANLVEAQVMPWVERGDDVADRVSPLSPEAVPEADFLRYAAAHLQLSDGDARAVFEALDRDGDDRLRDSELFV